MWFENKNQIKKKSFCNVFEKNMKVSGISLINYLDNQFEPFCSHILILAFSGFCPFFQLINILLFLVEDFLFMCQLWLL